MNHYKVYATGNDGQGIPQELQAWNGEDVLELHCNIFAGDVVISIEAVEGQEEVPYE